MSSVDVVAIEDIYLGPHFFSAPDALYRGQHCPG